MIALHGGKVILIDGKASCSCCETSYPVYFPSITRLTCGTKLDKSNFPAAVRDSIPTEAANMYWTKYVYFENRTGEETEEFLCDESTWATRRTGMEDSSFHYVTYDPENDCAVSTSCGGTGERTDKTREDPCGEPPDNTLTWDESRTYTMRATENTWDYTGTLNGSPISGDGLGVPLVPIIGIAPYPDYTDTLHLGAASVMVSRSREWDFEHIGSHTVGSNGYDTGYRDPDDYRIEVLIDDNGGTLDFVQFRMDVFFAPVGDVPAPVGEIVADWSTGDALTEVFAFAYPEIGTFSLGPACVRHNASHPFTCADVEP